LTEDTAWRAGRLGGARGPERLLFGQMHEDSAIEREAFRGLGRVFCIASAGSTAMDLAGEHEVVACDINPVQLAYARRRADGGPTEVGDAERGMAFARAFMPLVGWHARKVREFLNLTDPAEQLRFWRERLDGWRLRTGLGLAMSRTVLSAVYSPELLACLPKRFGAVLLSRMERGFGTHPNSENPYVRTLLTGKEREVRPADGIEFVCGDAASYLESCPGGSFDGFTLSNILDGAGEGYRNRLWRAVERAGNPGSKVVLRSFAEPAAGMVGNLAARDRTMLWGVVEIRG